VRRRPHHAGLSKGHIARQLGVSPRSVFRILASSDAAAAV
jgi:hypothetical protein